MSKFEYKGSRPARSDLYSLPPIGLGTSVVESLESFTCRLAQQHGVSRRTIEQHVNHDGEPLYHDTSAPPRLDAPTVLAAQFAERLSNATKRPEVRALGLGRMAGRIAPMHTLRDYRAWCGDCFCDARAAGQPAHLQLVWSLTEYQRCLKHGQVLEDHCPCCNRRSYASHTWSRALDHCPWCDKDLARKRQGRIPSFIHLSRRKDVVLDTFFARVLGEFAAETSKLTTPPPRACDLRSAVQAAIDNGLAKHHKQFAEHAGLSPSSLFCALRRENGCSLGILVRIAAAADVSMAGLLYQEARKEGVRGLPPLEIRASQRLRTNVKRDWDAIKSGARRSLDMGHPISMQQLARELGVDASYLSVKIVALAPLIRERADAARAEMRAQRLIDTTEAVKLACDSLRASHKSVSSRRIGEVVGMSEDGPYMRKAIKLVKELALEVSA